MKIICRSATKRLSPPAKRSSALAGALAANEVERVIVADDKQD